MIRLIVSTFFSISILTSSNITAKNAGKISNGSQTSTFSINKLDSAPAAKFSKLETKEKSLAAKGRSSALKKEMDTKIKFAKKLVSAKSKKTNQNRSSHSSTGNSNFDPSNFNLKMEKKSSHNNQPIYPT